MDIQNQARLTAEEMEPINIVIIGDSATQERFENCMTDEIAAYVSGNAMSAIGAIIGGEAAGVIVFTVEEAEAELQWLYVAPPFRRQYIASTLVGEFLDFLESDFFDGAVQNILMEYSDEGEGLYPFLNAIGFTQVAPGEQSVGISVRQLSSCPFMQRKASFGTDIRPMAFSELSAAHLRRLEQALERDGADFVALPFQENRFLYDASFSAWQTGEPVGCCAFSDMGDGRLALTVFYTARSAPTAALSLFRLAADALAARCPGDTVLEIPLLTESAKRLCEKLLADCCWPLGRMVEARLSLSALDEPQ